MRLVGSVKKSTLVITAAAATVGTATITTMPVASAAPTIASIVPAWRQTIPFGNGVCPTVLRTSSTRNLGTVSVNPNQHASGWYVYRTASSSETDSWSKSLYQDAATSARKVAHCQGYGKGYYEYLPVSIVHRFKSYGYTCLPLAFAGQTGEICLPWTHGPGSWIAGEFIG